MSLVWIRERIEEFRGSQAIFEGERILSYDTLIQEVDALRQRFAEWGMQPGDTVAFIGDYSVENVDPLCSHIGRWIRGRAHRRHRG